MEHGFVGVVKINGTTERREIERNGQERCPGMEVSWRNLRGALRWSLQYSKRRRTIRRKRMQGRSGRGGFTFIRSNLQDASGSRAVGRSGGDIYGALQWGRVR